MYGTALSAGGTNNLSGPSDGVSKTTPSERRAEERQNLLDQLKRCGLTHGRREMISNIADSRVRGIVNLTLGIFIAASRPSVTQEESSYAEGII